MEITRRKFVRLAALAAAASGIDLATAQQAPMLDQVRLFVGFPAGGGTDATARRLAVSLTGTYARAVVVENKPGAGARLPIEDIRRGPTDGSLLLMQPNSIMTQSPHADPKNTRYKFDDLAPVAAVTLIAQALAVGPAVPESVRTMRDFLEWAKANPDRGNFGTPAPNSIQSWLMLSGIRPHGYDLMHVPYKGSAPGVQDLLGGQVSAMFSPVGDFLPYLSTGKVRILGTSAAKRSRFAPEVPTFDEMGFKGMELSEHFGLWAKAGTPEAKLDRLHGLVQEMLAQKDVADYFATVGLDVAPMSRQDFGKYVRSGYDLWAERVQTMGFKTVD